jgi:HD-GYP domain-containing protein (c-di-GMP phosphodiesterase class II)
MAPAVDRSLLASTLEIFESLGRAFAGLQVYGESHPRYSTTLDQAQELLAKFFQERSSYVSVVFGINRDGVEFQRIPLVGLQAHGERLRRALGELSISMLQVDSGVTAEDVSRLASTLRERLRSADSQAPGENGEDRIGPFRLVSKDEARALAEARQAGSLTGSEDSTESTDLPDLMVSEAALAAVMASYRDVLSSTEQGRRLDYDGLHRATESVARLFGEPKTAATAAAARSYFDDFTFHHCLNVCMITTKVASFIVRDRELLTRISTAALLHDLGKTRIPTEILHKPARLTSGEMELMRTHPLLGAEILMSTSGVDPLCVSVAFGHHVSGGRGSYPETLAPYQTDWITKLISVIDIYEALTAVRPYKDGLPSEKAFEIMLSMPGFRDRLPIIKMVYDYVGPYPVGSVVELNTGERAKVIEQNLGSPYSPRVRIVTDRDRLPIPIPREVDLSKQEPLSIKRMVVVQRATDDPLQAEPGTDSSQVVGVPLDSEEIFLVQEG